MNEPAWKGKLWEIVESDDTKLSGRDARKIDDWAIASMSGWQPTKKQEAEIERLWQEVFG